MKENYNYMSKLRKSGMTSLQIAQMKAIADEATKKIEVECLEKGFVFASSVFLNVLIADYWQKTAKTKVPKLMEEVLKLYSTVLKEGADVVNYKQLRDYIADETGYKLEFDWLDELEDDCKVM